ncbi:CNH-domain-containing protein [Phanerochaete sordida]|uniref:CNH-domain-containing protein n=1 Tax=Phanerochaete sordida TaxID=48140 RepID=A0A9P3G6B5_9APHY|nr:CNH-domain-containing protein [Phanerochaete sordida]
MNSSSTTLVEANSTPDAQVRVDISDLASRLVFRPGEETDLGLTEGHTILYQSVLARTHAGSQEGHDQRLVLLLDHLLLVLRPQPDQERYEVCLRPIPLDLLIVSATAISKGPSGMTEALNLISCVNPSQAQEAEQGFPITFARLGRKSGQMTCWATTFEIQQGWIRRVRKQQEAMQERKRPIATELLARKVVSCAVPYDQGRKIIYGIASGVYLLELGESRHDPVKVLSMSGVTQIDVMQSARLLIVLAEGVLLAFPLDVLDTEDSAANLERAQRLASRVSFFKVGMCMGKVVLCAVKPSALSSTVKVFEPAPENRARSIVPTLRRLVRSNPPLLAVLKEFYIPKQIYSVSVLKTKLCLVCAGAFEIIDLESLGMQPLLDPADESLKFASGRGSLEAVALFRIKDNFLACYNEIAFYLDKTGRHVKSEVSLIRWEGRPTSFAVHHPYIFAFDPAFVEVRHVETGQLVQVIPGGHIRCLFSRAPPPKADWAETSEEQGNVLVGSDEGIVELQISTPDEVVAHGRWWSFLCSAFAESYVLSLFPGTMWSKCSMPRR